MLLSEKKINEKMFDISIKGQTELDKIFYKVFEICIWNSFKSVKLCSFKWTWSISIDSISYSQLY